MRGRRTRRPGSNIVELLLVVLILIVLGLLVIPAVQKVRSLSHRLECQNRMKQLAHALHLHHDSRGVFPGLGGYGDEVRYLRLIRPAALAEDERLGLGLPYATPETQPGSWIYQLLPYLDADGLARIRASRPAGLGVRIQGLLCPARGRPELIETPSRDPLFPGVAYASQPEGFTLWGRTDYAANGRLLRGRGEPLVRFADTRPGLSNAILAGEKGLTPSAYASGGWLLDGPALVGGSTCARTGSTILHDWDSTPLTTDAPVVTSWGSAHPHGTHFLFAGGEVRIIQGTVSREMFQRLLGPAPSPPSGNID